MPNKITSCCGRKTVKPVKKTVARPTPIKRVISKPKPKK